MAAAGQLAGQPVFLAAEVGHLDGPLLPLAGPGLWILVLFPIVFIGMASLVRCIAATSGNVNNPYIAMPYDPRPRWRRLLFGR